jgi:hypothetical protein
MRPEQTKAKLSFELSQIPPKRDRGNITLLAKLNERRNLDAGGCAGCCPIPFGELPGGSHNFNGSE